MKKLTVASLIAALTLGVAGTTSVAQERYVTIGTGGQTGVYYVVGQSICRLVNRNQAEHGIKCTAPSTGGSVANLNAIKAGEQNMGVAQSDQQYNALEGNDPFSEPFAELRAVFAVHPEPYTVVARKDANVQNFDDLKGKRVNIGNPGSGQRATTDAIMGVKGWTKDDFKLASELKAAEQAQALCDNKIDAMVYVVGHPNGSIKEATTSCEANLVDVAGPDVDQLVSDNPYYAKAVIPGGMYDGTPDDTETFGVVATFVSSTQTDEDTIYQIVKAVFDNFDRFQRLHPAFVNLKPENMIKDGLSAPLHDGAAKYYKEQGWIE